jgi:hypothetical protein
MEIILRGSPDEMTRFFAHRTDLSPDFNSAEQPPELPEQVREWLDEWAIRPPRRGLIEQLFANTLSLDGVRHRITKGRKGETRFAARVGFVKKNEKQAFGFFLQRGLLILRLDKETDISEFTFARKRNIKGRRFGIQIYVRSEEELKEAINLLQLAYEAE